MALNNTNWIDVPKDTTIFISLEVPPGEFASGHVDCSRCVPPTIEDAEMRPGPAKRTMTSPPKSYNYRVRITFGNACTVTLRARLEKSDKTPYGDPFAFTVTGNAGDVKEAQIGCLMVRP